MANQHDSLNHRALREKGCSIDVFLKDCVAKDWNLDEIAVSLRASVGSIRKWANKYGIKIEPGLTVHEEPSKFWELFGSIDLNEANFLSRTWQNKGEGDAVKV